MNNDDTAVLSTVPVGDDEPREDGLAAELAHAAPRRWWNRGTLVLGALVLLLGGFVGGLQAQQQWGTAGSAAGGNRAAAGGFPGGGQNRAGYGFPGGGAAPAAAPAGTAAAGGTSGTVKLVDGTTIYVETANGDVVTVKTDGRTTVSTAATGKLGDVKAGQKVTVQGSAGTDGTVTATAVTAQKK